MSDTPVVTKEQYRQGDGWLSPGDVSVDKRFGGTWPIDIRLDTWSRFAILALPKQAERQAAMIRKYLAGHNVRATDEGVSGMLNDLGIPHGCSV